MNTDKPEEVDILDQYWDALAHGNAFDGDQIDPATAEALQHLHQRSVTTGPEPMFVERLRRQLVGETVHSGMEVQPEYAPDDNRIHNESRKSSQYYSPMPQEDWDAVTGNDRRGWLGQAGQIAAALVAFSVLTGLLMLVFRDGGGTEPNPGVGAGIGTPTSLPQPNIPAELQSSVLVLRSDGEQQGEIRPVDPATGDPLPGYSLTTREDSEFIVPHAVSPHGGQLAVVESRGTVSEPSAGGSATRASADALRLVDLSNWQEVTASLPGEGWVQPIVFSPDASRIALVYHDYPADTLMLFDGESGELVAQRDLTFRPSLVNFTSDGASLILYGQPLGENPGITRPDPPQVLLLDVADLAVNWERTLPDVLSGRWCLEQCQAPHQNGGVFANWDPGVALSPGGRTLYIVHADTEQVMTVDLNDHTVETIELQADQSLTDRLLGLVASEAAAKVETTGAGKVVVVSPDGNRLYVVGQTVTATSDGRGEESTAKEAPGRLRVIELASGRIIASRESEASEITIASDGAHLFLQSWTQDNGEPWTDVIDAESLERVAHLEGWEVGTTQRLGGQPVLLDQQHEYNQGRSTTQFGVLNPNSFEVIHSWTVNGYASWVIP